MKANTKEIVITAMLGAVIGVLFTLLDYVYMPLSTLLGTVFMELTFGIYMLSAALPMYLVRKPGIALFGALVAAAVNLLLGSPYGIQLILANVLEAAAVELAYLLVTRYRGSIANLVLGQILGAIFVLVRDMLVWGTPLIYGTGVASLVVLVRVLSSVFIGILLVKLIAAALVKSGVLKGFACARPKGLTFTGGPRA